MRAEKLQCFMMKIEVFIVSKIASTQLFTLHSLANETLSSSLIHYAEFFFFFYCLKMMMGEGTRV